MLWVPIFIFVVLIIGCILDYIREKQTGKESRLYWLKRLYYISNILIAVAIIYGMDAIQIHRHEQEFKVFEKFYEEWNSEKFGIIQQEFKATKQITADSLKGNLVILCNFFERVGMYERKDMINIEDVYDILGPYPCIYWNGLENAIYDYRNKYNLPNVWEDYENLCTKIMEIENKEGNK